jgi:hypothetical protein
LFCLSCWNLPNHNTSIMFLVLFESLPGIGVHKVVWRCLNLWGKSYWILDSFVKENLIKIKTKYIEEIGVYFLYCWNSFNK